MAGISRDDGDGVLMKIFVIQRDNWLRISRWSVEIQWKAELEVCSRSAELEPVTGRLDWRVGNGR